MPRDYLYTPAIYNKQANLFFSAPSVRQNFSSLKMKVIRHRGYHRKQRHLPGLYF